ncbi:MAG: 50S ribosomal protein L20 [Phycisphaerae bacterium]
MPRARPGSARHRRVKRTLQSAKGYRLGRSKLLRRARDTATRALVYARRDRRARKRDFRSLWIIRLTAACRERGIRYALFVNGLKKANIALNRKMLSELAIHDPAGFDAVVALVRKALGREAA